MGPSPRRPPRSHPVGEPWFRQIPSNTPRDTLAQLPPWQKCETPPTAADDISYADEEVHRQYELVRAGSESAQSKAWQGHAMRAARRSIDSHANRLMQARSYRGRELPHGWGGRWFGPSTEADKGEGGTGTTDGREPHGFSSASERFM